MLKLPKKKFQTNKFDCVIDQFERVADRTGDLNYPLFHPEVLFIYIAYLVNIYSNPSNDNTALRPARERDFKSWEEKSGEMCVELFKVGEDGEMDLNKLQSISNEQDNGVHLDKTMGFEISLAKIAIDVQKNNGLPSLSLIHEEVMAKMYKTIYNQSTSNLPLTQDREEFKKLLAVFGDSRDNNIHVKNQTQNREKQRKHWKRKRNSAVPYIPVNPRDFQRDIFMMGRHSYYYHFCTKEGATAREFLLHG